jgi:hypothetical protein
MSPQGYFLAATMAWMLPLAANAWQPPSYLGFALEKRPLAFNAPPVSRQVAIGAHSSMTWNCDR